MEMERMGRKVPTLQNRPDLPLYLELYLTAYLQLSTEREIGMVAGPIPYSSILQWAYAMGMDDVDDIDDLASVIWKADHMVQDFYRNKKPQSMTGAKPVLPPPTGKLIGR